MSGQKGRSGGSRKNAGRKRQYIYKKLPILNYVARTEPEMLTPKSDLEICLAEMPVDENENRRGIVIGEVWYGYEEALAIATFVKEHRQWLTQGDEALPDE